MSVRLPRRAGVHVAVLSLFVLLTLVHTRPLVFHLRDAVVEGHEPDVQLHSWIVSHTARALGREPARVFESNSFFPYPESLAYTEHMIPEALPVVPVWWASGDPILTYNVAFLLSFVLSGWAGFLLVRGLTGSVAAGVVAGTFLCWFPAKHWSVGHINTISLQFVPLALLALHRVLERPRVARVIALALLAALAALSSAYYTIYVPLTLVVATPLLWWAGGQPFERTRVLAVGAAGLLTALLATPVLLPYARLWEAGVYYRDYATKVRLSNDLTDFFDAATLLWRTRDIGFFPGAIVVALVLLGACALWRRAPGGGSPAVAADPAGSLRRMGRVLFVASAALVAIQALLIIRVSWAEAPPPDRILWLHAGLLAAAGAAAAVAGRMLGRRASAPPSLAAAARVPRSYSLLALLPALLSLGPQLQVYGYLGPVLPSHWLAEAPFFAGLRAPFRAAFLATVLLAVPMGFGVVWVIDTLRRAAAGRRPRLAARVAPIVASLLVLGITLETLGRPLSVVPPPAPEPALDRWLAELPDHVGVLEWPQPEALYLTAADQWRSTGHWKQLPFGHNGVVPDRVAELFGKLDGDFDEAAVRLIVERFPVRYVVLHLHRLGPEARAAFERDRLPLLVERWPLAQELDDDLVLRAYNGSRESPFSRFLPLDLARGDLHVRLSRAVRGGEGVRVGLVIDGRPPGRIRIRAGEQELVTSLPERAPDDRSTDRRRDPVVSVRIRLEGPEDLWVQEVYVVDPAGRRTP